LSGPVLLATLAGGWERYWPWPTAAAYRQRGYEAKSTPAEFSAGDGEKRIDAILQIAHGT
jgi:hypothetical protein